MIEEGGNGDFIGGVQGTRQRATFLHGFASQAEAGKTARGGFLEVEAAEFGPIELDLLRGDAIGISERVLDGHAHIGRGELSEDGTIDKFNEGVDDRLGMNDDVDLVGAHVEEPAGFNDLEALVHHGGGVDGDAVAHFPVGMSESLGDGDGWP